MQQVIQFKKDQSSLVESAKDVLKNKAGQLHTNPELRVVIASADSTPMRDNQNMALGLRRARVTKAYLVAQGIAPERIDIKSRTERGTQVLQRTDTARTDVRRNEVTLLIADAVEAAFRNY
jgi:outer membrane protein OmpA-like peptidoglycan-associated protein